MKRKALLFHCDPPAAINVALALIGDALPHLHSPLEIDFDQALTDLELCGKMGDGVRKAA